MVSLLVVSLSVVFDWRFFFGGVLSGDGLIDDVLSDGVLLGDVFSGGILIVGVLSGSVLIGGDMVEAWWIRDDIFFIGCMFCLVSCSVNPYTEFFGSFNFRDKVMSSATSTQ